MERDSSDRADRDGLKGGQIRDTHRVLAASASAFPLSAMTVESKSSETNTERRREKDREGRDSRARKKESEASWDTTLYSLFLYIFLSSITVSCC